MQRYEDAFASCNQALGIQPEFYPAWKNRSYSLEKLGRYQEALNSYNITITFQADDADV
jgi:tetratricopeptide (TPR) repeat protein